MNEAYAELFETIGPLADAMGITVLEISPDVTSARMPVERNTQPYGILHGGASAVLAESVGSVAAMAHAGPGRIAVGVELNISHHKSVRTGHVVGTARCLTRGRTLASYAIEIRTEETDDLVATARLTCLVRDRGGRVVG